MWGVRGARYVEGQKRPLPEETFEQDPEGSQVAATGTSGTSAFQAEGTASTKPQGCNWLGTFEKKAEGSELSMWEEVDGVREGKVEVGEVI